MLNSFIYRGFNYKTAIIKQNTKTSEMKKKWKDVTRRETMEAAETSIDKTIEHYEKKVEFINGPKVVKTFK
jgi:hypothetical protein